MSELLVSRTGGFAGLQVSGTVAVADPDALAARLTCVPPHRPAPDRYVYRLTLGEQSVTVGEADLPEDLRDLVAAALEQG